MQERHNLLTGSSKVRILVIGDLILDRHVHCEAERVSPEAAALILRFDHEEHRLGGAAGVATMGSSLGANVGVAAVCGDDEAGRLLVRLFATAGLKCHAIHTDPERSTTVKERFLGRSGKGPWQHLLRVDRESRAPLPAPLQRRLAKLVVADLDACDSLLVADHDKGVCTPELLAEVIGAARQRGVPVLVDPARGKDVTVYRGADLLLPNREEASVACGRRLDTPQEALEAARELSRRTRIPAVLMKMDADGMVLTVDGQPDRIFAARNHNPLDVTGAGDMVLAVMGLSRAWGVPWHEAAELASVAAGLEVARMGAQAVTTAELRDALRAESNPAPQPPHPLASLATAGAGVKDQRGGEVAPKQVALEEMVALTERYRSDGRRVVLTNGCFDLLHAGHASYLKEAASLGDILVVAINDDAGIRRLKGKGRPVIGQADRAALLAALSCVDHVVIFAEDTPHEVLRRVRPDVLVKGGDYTVEQVVGRELVEAYGGRVCVTGKREGLSTSRVIAAVRQGTGWE